MTTTNSMEIAAVAVKLAKELGSSKEVTAMVETALKAKDETQRSAIVLYFNFVHRLPADKKAMFPRVNSEGSNNPDKFKYTERNEKGEEVTRRGSFFSTWADNIAYGLHIQKVLKWLDELSADGGEVSEDNEFADRDLGTMQLDSLKAQWKGRRDGNRSLWRRAFKVGEQLEAVATMRPKVTCELSTVDNGEGKEVLSSSTKPIFIYDSSNMPASQKHFKSMGAQQFLSLNVAKANAKGGTYAALIASAEKSGDKKKGTKEAKLSMDNYLAKFGEFADFTEEHTAAILKKFTSDKTRAEWIENFGDGAIEIISAFSKIEAEYKEIKKAKKLAANKTASDADTAEREQLSA